MLLCDYISNDPVKYFLDDNCNKKKKQKKQKSRW